MIDAVIKSEIRTRLNKIRSIILAGDTVEAYSKKYTVIEVGETIVTDGGVFYKEEVIKIN